MSKLFYDHLVVLNEIELVIRNITETSEEREELWDLVDQIVHHRILDCILGNLPVDCHEEFLCKFHALPSDERIMIYLKERTGKDMESLLEEEISLIESELLKEIGE